MKSQKKIPHGLSKTYTDEWHGWDGYFMTDNYYHFGMQYFIYEHNEYYGASDQESIIYCGKIGELNHGLYYTNLTYDKGILPSNSEVTIGYFYYGTKIYMSTYTVSVLDRPGLANGCTKYIIDYLGNEIVVPIHVRHLSSDRSDHIDVYPYFDSYGEGFSFSVGEVPPSNILTAAELAAINAVLENIDQDTNFVPLPGYWPTR